MNTYTETNAIKGEDDIKDLLEKGDENERIRIKLEDLSDIIKKGAKTFLFEEYLYLTVFIAIFAVIIFLFAEHKRGTFYTTVSFIIGAYTSILCGYIGMMIATSANGKTAYCAM